MSIRAGNPRPVSPAALHAATGLVMLLSLWGALQFYQTQKLFDRASRDPYGIGYQQDRFREAAKLLPEGAVVGYLSDVPVDSDRGVQVFLSTQYVLAPRLLVEWDGKQRPRWVLGNYSGEADFPELAKSRGLTLVKDFGTGVAVFRDPGR